MVGVASRLVCLHELIEFCVGAGLGSDHAVVGAGLSPNQLIELALKHELLAALCVLDREHHHHGDRRTCGVQHRLPPGWETGRDADDDPAGQQARNGHSCGCLGGPAAELVQQVATASVVRAVQDPRLVGVVMEGARRR